MSFYTQKNYIFSAFPPDDSYKIHSVFERLKLQYNLKNVQLLKAQGMDSLCFYMAGLNQSTVILSENVLESFSERDMACFLSYAFQKIKSGEALFLTVLSSFIFLLERVFYILNYPFSFFKKQKIDSRGMMFLFKLLSFTTKRIFYRNDKKLSLNKNQPAREQALFLWKLDSFIKLNPPQLPVFFAPLFLISFLTNSYGESYSSLQPLIKDRVKKLVGSFPP